MTKEAASNHRLCQETSAPHDAITEKPEHPRTSWSPLAACSLHSSKHSPRVWRPSRSSSAVEAESTDLRRLSAADRYKSLDFRRLAFWNRSRPCFNVGFSSLGAPAAAPPAIRPVRVIEDETMYVYQTIVRMRASMGVLSSVVPLFFCGFFRRDCCRGDSFGGGGAISPCVAFSLSRVLVIHPSAMQDFQRDCAKNQENAINLCPHTHTHTHKHA